MWISRFFLVAAVACAPLAAGAQTPAPVAPAAPPAQGQAEMLRMMHLAARNQLGVLEFCQAQGSVGADVVALQQRLLGMLPAADVPGLAAAEAAGKQGMVQFGGSEVKLADAAKAQNTTPDAMCKTMASMLQSQAAQLPK